MTLALIFDSASFGEWFVLLAVVLIVVGPKRLPSTARKLGGYYSKFRRAAENFKRQIMDMETEFDKASAAAEREVEGAFQSRGDESKAVPLDIENGISIPEPKAEAPAAEGPANDAAGAEGAAEKKGD